MSEPQIDWFNGVHAGNHARIILNSQCWTSRGVERPANRQPTAGLNCGPLPKEQHLINLQPLSATVFGFSALAEAHLPRPAVATSPDLDMPALQRQSRRQRAGAMTATDAGSQDQASSGRAVGLAALRHAHLWSCRTFYSLRRGVEGCYTADRSLAVLFSRSLRPLRDAVPQNQDPVGVETAGVGAARRLLPTQAVAQPCKRPLLGNPATTSKSRRVNITGTSRGGTTALAAVANLTAAAHTSCPGPLSSRRHSNAAGLGYSAGISTKQPSTGVIEVSDSDCDTSPEDNVEEDDVMEDGGDVDVQESQGGRSAGQPLLDDHEADLAGSGLYVLRECSDAECCCHAAMLREPD